jgi:hypothetical protein
MPWPSLDVASRVSDFANILLIACLFLGVVSTGTIVWMSNVKESHWAVLRQQSNEKIAEANARQKEAELKLAEFARKVSPRPLTEEQASLVINDLKKFPGTPFSVEADPGAEHEFVNNIISILQQAEWRWVRYEVSPNTLPMGYHPMMAGHTLSGIQIRARSA